MSKAKYIKKSKLQFKDGNLVTKKGKVVFVEPRIINQFNLLEELNQKKNWMLEAMDVAGDTMEPFKFESASKAKLDYNFIDISTPYLDAQIDDSIKLASDIDKVTLRYKTKEYIETKLPDLLKFVRQDEVLVYDDGIGGFDLKTLENPLKYNERQITSLVYICLEIAMDFSNQLLSNE